MAHIKLKGIGLSLVTGLLLLTSMRVSALITIGEGNNPIQDPGWPQGALAVANLTSRLVSRHA